MNASEKKRRGWWALAGVAVLPFVLLLGAYVGAYYWLVKPIPSNYEVITDPDKPPVRMRGVDPGYPSEGMPWFFNPIHQIDRAWIRPRTWEYPADEIPPENQDTT